MLAPILLPVTSYQWSCILQRMGENSTFEQAGAIDVNADFDTSLARLSCRLGSPAERRMVGPFAMMAISGGS